MAQVQSLEVHLLQDILYQKNCHSIQPFCFLYVRYDVNHLSKLPLILYFSMLKMSPLCHTLSNAFVKSKNTPINSSPLSKSLYSKLQIYIN